MINIFLKSNNLRKQLHVRITMSNLFKFINLSDRSNNISEDDDSKLNGSESCAGK